MLVLTSDSDRGTSSVADVAVDNVRGNGGDGGAATVSEATRVTVIALPRGGNRCRTDAGCIVVTNWTVH